MSKMSKNDFVKTEVPKVVPAPVLTPVKTEGAKVVYTLAEAEELQKSGWELLDCHLALKGKEYTFQKGKK